QGGRAVAQDRRLPGPLAPAGGARVDSRTLRARRGKPRRPKVALVCAGGGVTGAVWEIGALRALEELLDRSVLDLDLYVGVSGGAFVATLLAAGVSPRDLYDEGAGRRLLGRGVPPLFRLGLR